MKFTKTKISNFILAAFGCILFLSSCVPQSKILYMQDKGADISSIENNQRIASKIQPNDELYIRVNSFDEKTYGFFNLDSKSQNNSSTSVSLISYTVDELGNITLPFAGKIAVGGLTLEQAKDVIEKNLTRYVNDVTVMIKFVGNSITILGEVNRPGRYEVIKGQNTIFQAIGLAGDITNFGNRNEVVLVREEGAQTMFYKLDLTDKNIVKSPQYFLKPNDVLIIHPLAQKQWGFQSFPYSILFTAITTAIVTLNFLKK